MKRALKWTFCIIVSAIIVVSGAILVPLWLCFNDYQENVILYDKISKQISPEISFWEILRNRNKYIDIPKKIELVNMEMNIAYKAEFQMPRNPKAIQEYVTGSLSNDQIQKDLTEKIGSCIRAMGRQGLQVKGYPLMVIRAISIYNMDELCPIIDSHGYQWEGTFALVQCAGDLPLNNAQKNDCLNQARFAHY